MNDYLAAQTQTAPKPNIAPKSGSVLQRQCACGQHTSAGGECEDCKQKREGIQQRAVISPAPVYDVPPIVREVLWSPGQPLEAATRAFMEPRFGHDFSGVRVHADAKAAESAQAVDALAYTVGRNIVFGSGQYSPETNAGQQLLAHELTHVRQQANGLPGTSTLGTIQRQPDGTATSGAESAEDAPLKLEGEAKAAENPPRPGTSESLLGLRYGLNRVGKAPVWSLLDGKSLALTSPLSMPQLLPAASALTGGEPLKMAFGPLTSDEALQALLYVRPKPDWFAEMLWTRKTKERGLDLWIIYENDGSGIVPNFGSGSDQGRTAALYLAATFNKHGTGISKVGLTAIEMVTPRGTLPPGAPNGPESRYETPPGPYSGIMAIDVGVTVSRSGTSKLDFIASAGVDSREWGKLVQDTIHKKVSNSPLFPWPKGTKPLLEAGVNWNHTINALTSSEFAGLKYTGRLELDAKAITGTRRTEGTLGARFVVRTAQVHTPFGAISAEFSPIGALVRGFARYNDGRPATLLGVEGGVNSSMMVNIGRVGVGLLGEAIMSTDPAFQTSNPAGSGPTALGAGTISSAPAGHHGTGQLILRFSF